MIAKSMIAEPNCYHCGLPVLAGVDFSTPIFGQQRKMCCRGCQSVAESIVENGLEEYYNHRTELPKTVEDLVPEELRQVALYDHPDVQKSFVLDNNNELKEASLILEGITCAACIWLNERHLKQLKGVKSVAINYASHRARVCWDEREIKLSQILGEIRKLGYNAHPFSAQQQDALRKQQRKADFKRLAVAGLSAGQVMMIAVALYAGSAQGLEFANAQLLRWFSLVLTLPAITYAAWPFYRAAWRGVTSRHIGMDVPIAIGIITGFAGSVWTTLHGAGVVYYDTITMLIFFLLGTRYLERNAREKSIEAAENLLRLAPAMATRVLNNKQDSDDGYSEDKYGGDQELVSVMELMLGDLILAKPGEAIAADGTIVNGESSVDESLLTGEAHPLPKSVGSQVFAGSINYESPLVISVTAIAENTMLAGISRLLDRAQSEKPKLAEAADRIATYFTTVLLMTAVTVGLVWWQIDPHRTLEIVLTVLVVSCPCALSLAAPAAFAAAGSHLVQRGVLLTRGYAMEALAKATYFVFDKTGTLTQGKPVLLKTVIYADMAEAECMKLAASLEKSSEHPLAKSFIAVMQNQALYQVTDSRNVPGQGVIGSINGTRYSLGNAKLNLGIAVPELNCADYPPGATIIWLTETDRLLAAFILADQPRAEAAVLIKRLQGLGVRVCILSGDSNQAVAHFSQSIEVQNWQASLSPEQKLSQLRLLQQQGEIVAMVGDGINDAPVLAGANVSIAMGSGTQMARVTGDIVLLADGLLEIEHAVITSRFAISVVRQNFLWALCYNLIALPFAATGLISPWMAAIGMSVSSLIVVLNALRLR